MQEFDAIIVGAGPAGLAAARKLAEAKMNVICLEKKQEIGVPKRCAEGLGGGWFERLGIKPDKRWAVREIEGAALYAPSGKKLELRFGKTAGYVLERRVFEKELAKQAVNAGAKIRVKHPVTSAVRENGKVKIEAGVRGDEEEYSAPLVLACDGVETQTARMLGLNTVNKLNDIDSGYQYEMAGIDYEGDDLINLFFGEDGTTEGTAKSYLDKFVESHPGLKQGSIVEVNAGAVPVGGFLDDMTADNLLVAGDAAHHVNPIHGGGIGLAMEGARIASDIAIGAHNAGDYSHKFLQKYNPIWYEKRGNQLKSILKRRHLFESLSDENLETLVNSLTGDDVLKIAEGELIESAKIVGKKLIKYPGLTKIMLKYLK